jgi:hypothetical protein
VFLALDLLEHRLTFTGSGSGTASSTINLTTGHFDCSQKTVPDQYDEILRLISEVREMRLRVAALRSRMVAEREACEKRARDVFRRADQAQLRPRPKTHRPT